MSEEREVTRLKKSGETHTVSLTKARELLPQEGETFDQKKARFTRILERGIVADRLIVELPDGLYGEWVPRDQVEIDRKRLLGFEIDDQHAIRRGLHSDGTDRPIVGDCVFMVCSAETKQLIDDVKRERYRQRHGKPGEVRKGQEEETSFKKDVDSRLGMPVIDESVARPANRDDIAAALSEEVTRK
jgi:hypothetical protein